MFQVNSASRGFILKIKPYFLRKIKVKKLKCLLLQFLFGALRVNLGHRHVSVHLSDSEQNLSEVAL